MTNKAEALRLIVEVTCRHNLPAPAAIDLFLPPAALFFGDGDVASVEAWGRVMDHGSSAATEINDWVRYDITGHIDGHLVKAWCSVGHDEGVVS